MTEMSAGGSQQPQHRGQSGQPSPAPETRTSPPTRISSNVAINVEVAKTRKRFEMDTLLFVLFRASVFFKNATGISPSYCFIRTRLLTLRTAPSLVCKRSSTINTASQMHKQFTIQIQTSLISLFLLGCGSEIQREGLVEGEILDLDSDSVTLLLEDRGWFSKSEELSIPLRNESDSLWLAKGMSVRAELRSNDNRLALQSVWPADPAVESKLIKTNQLLRRDTVHRGQEAFREVGEALPEFALYDQDGHLVTRDSLKGRWTVMHFIFTRCTAQEMCPASSSKMAQLLKALKTKGAQNPLLVSFTLDPRFDTPGVLKSYAMGFGLDDPQSRLLTGPLQAIQDLKKQLGVLSKPHETLLIQHTMRTILADPDLNIVYQVPHRTWGVEDFLSKILEPTSSGPS